jgi:DNA-binding NarL/FixJ family response regulator
MEVGGLRAKKAEDFRLWMRAVDLLVNVGGSKSGPAAQELESLKSQLHASKVFDHAAIEGAQQFGAKAERTPNPGRLMHYKRLTQDQALEIIRLRDEGMEQKQIAIKMGVSQMTVSRLVRGQYRRVGASAAAVQSKITLEKIDEMVERYNRGELPKALQTEYGVGQAQFYRFTNGKFDRRYYPSEA